MIDGMIMEYIRKIITPNTDPVAAATFAAYYNDRVPIDLEAIETVVKEAERLLRAAKTPEQLESALTKLFGKKAPQKAMPISEAIGRMKAQQSVERKEMEKDV